MHELAREALLPGWPSRALRHSQKRARPTVSLIAREHTEHDEEHKSISIVEELLSQVARKLHGTSPQDQGVGEHKYGKSGVEEQTEVNSGTFVMDPIF